jgi:predicted ATP-binding protein involved in virulence
MKIRSLTLKNIGVFEYETISFPEKQDKDLAPSTGAEIHILTGQNGTGKTTILQALASGVNYSNVFNYPTKFSKIFNKKFINGKSEASIVFNNGNSVYLTGNHNSPGNYSTDEAFKALIAFAYSSYLLVQHQENIDITKNFNYNPLANALEFDKTNIQNDYTLSEWLAINSSKRALARESGDDNGVKRFEENINNIQKIVQDVISEHIKFEVIYDTGMKVNANINGKKLDFDLLPDGLRSIISWLGDLIMRMDALKWKDDLPIFEREFILFLDEIEVHLHPSWQRKILPVVQKLFKNAQIFITTHSPFIVNSVDGAYIYKLDLDENGHSKVTKVTTSDSSKSYQNIIREVFEVSRFSESLEKELKEFTDTRNDILLNKNIDENAFLNKAHQLASLNDEVKNTILFELRQLSKKTGKEYAL